MYRVGDFVFFEQLPSAPYQIRKIEELNRCPNGTVEAKVLCFLRRRDLSLSLVEKADQHLKKCIYADPTIKYDKLSQQDLAKISDRELFINRQVETVSATCIRGKCTVTPYHENESLLSYINQDERFFYALVYDPISKTLSCDKGDIHVGAHHQAAIPDLINGSPCNEDLTLPRDQLLWSASACPLSDNDLQEYLILSRSIATLARSSHLPSCIRQPNLVHTAAAASRDITTERALTVLHQCNYDMAQAISCMVHWNEKNCNSNASSYDMEKDGKYPSSDSVSGTSLALWRDEMELWSVSESNMFEEALEKYNKFFHDIRTHYLPWKSVQSIVAYYYMWKTTEPYVAHRQSKAAAAENRLRQVYIPNYTHQPSASILFSPNALQPSSGGCESCHAPISPLWYAWGRPGSLFKVCENCWLYWKRYGALKARLGDAISLGDNPSLSNGNSPAVTNGSEVGAPTKERSTICLPPSDSTVMAQCLAPPVGEWCEAILPAQFPTLVRHMIRIHGCTEEYSNMLAASCLQHAKPLGVLLAKLGSQQKGVTTNNTANVASAEKMPAIHHSTPLLRLARSVILPELISDKASRNDTSKVESFSVLFRRIARKGGVMPQEKLPWDKVSLIKACFAKMATIDIGEANSAIRARNYTIPPKALSGKCEGGMKRVYSQVNPSFPSQINDDGTEVNIDSLFLPKQKDSSSNDHPVNCGAEESAGKTLLNNSNSNKKENTSITPESITSSSEMLFCITNIREMRNLLGSNALRTFARRPSNDQLCEKAKTVFKARPN